MTVVGHQIAGVDGEVWKLQDTNSDITKPKPSKG
jgi:hypothetical protein